MRHRLSLIISLLVAAVTAAAQATFEARLDTVYMLIGQQRELTFDATFDRTQRLVLPQLVPGQHLTDVVEVVSLLGTDTTALNDGNRLQVQQRWSITAFDSALVYLPPFEARVDSQTYRSKPLALKVLMIDVDTLHVDQFFPPKDIHDNPFSWTDYRPILLWSLLALVIAVALVYVVARRVQNKPIVRIIRRAPKRPAHQVAMEEIERIKSEKRWADEDSKEYYTQLTDTIRKYINDRYGFQATEMTSTEIIDRLLQENDVEALAELRSLFETADLVKFAKWTTMINENDANLVNAIDFINQNKLEVVAKPEPEVITVEEKQERHRYIAMRIAIVLLSLLLAATAGYAVWLLTDLLL